MTNTIERIPVEDLYVSCVDTKSRFVDWTQGYYYGESGETGWECFDTHECEECGEIVVVIGMTQEQHKYIDETGESECEGYIYAEGPMMNFFYPVYPGSYAEGKDPKELALKIADLPLCIIEFTDTGEIGMALTGGGMDLSWEICEAYTRLGFLPPVQVCDDLPHMVNKTEERDGYVVEACIRSCDVLSGWVLCAKNRLQNFWGE